MEFCAQVSQSVHKISDDVGPTVWRIVAAPSECPLTCPGDTEYSQPPFSRFLQPHPSSTPIILTGGRPEGWGS